MDTQMSNKFTKKLYLIIHQGMNIKITIRYTYIPIKIAIIKKWKNQSSQVCGSIGTLSTALVWHSNSSPDYAPNKKLYVYAPKYMYKTAHSSLIVITSY